MKIYVYIDGGSIHKNSHTDYFAVGGYFALEQDKVKITSKYKKINLQLKKSKKLPLNSEIKSYDMSKEEKIYILNKIQDIDTFHGCAKIFNKILMKKAIINSDIFFNYAVKILFLDCIIPILNLVQEKEQIQFIVSIDNRNIRIGDLNNLETYLKTEFCLQNYDFKVTYYDSKSNYGIQLADLIVNTFYNQYKDITIVDSVIDILKQKNFRANIFPRQ